MKQFMERHGAEIKAVLSGPDRLMFQGTIRELFIPNWLEGFLHEKEIRYADFGKTAKQCSERIRAFAMKSAESSGRKYIYLSSFRTSKEETAAAEAAACNVKEGLICVIGCVESCQSPQIVPSPKGPRFVNRKRRGLAVYFYFMDREFGQMYVRLHTWWPFLIQVYVNGRSYLARQLKRERISFRCEDNCFTQIADWERAQQLLDQLTRRKWARTLNAFAQRVNPLFGDLLEGREYYWTLAQSEHATDIVFRANHAERLFPRFVEHSLLHMSSKDIMRYFGRQQTTGSNRVSSHFRQMEGGARVKHWFGKNSIKIYNKTRSLIRVETTINDPGAWTISRTDTKSGKGSLRKGIVDFQAREMVARAANGRYLDALSVVSDEAQAAEVLDPMTAPIHRNGRRYRGLRPTTPDDAHLLRLLVDGSNLTAGFRNRDIARLLEPDEFNDPSSRRRLSARTSRRLALLRSHGLIRKARNRNVYYVTDRGVRVAAASQAARTAQIAEVQKKTLI